MIARIWDSSTVELKRLMDQTGNKTLLESNMEVPFDVKRVFYLYDIPIGKERGAHAHKKCHQFLVAASGSFEVEIDDGISKKNVAINKPYLGVHIPPGLWSAEKNFSFGAVCLVLASHKYEADDYIRDYKKYLAYQGLK